MAAATGVTTNNPSTTTTTTTNNNNNNNNNNNINTDATTISANATTDCPAMSTSTPQRRPRRSSLRKGDGGRGGGVQAEERRVAFSRSRSLSENRYSWSVSHDGALDRKDTGGSFCRVRSFKSTRKGLVRNGESFKSVDTRNFMSAGSVRVYRKLSMIGRSESVDSTDSSVGGSSVAESYYRVAVLGAAGVGKRKLIQQFISSEEQVENTNLPNEDSEVPVTVSVLLDGEESLLEFLDSSEDAGSKSQSSPSSPLTPPTTKTTATTTSTRRLSSDEGGDVDFCPIALAHCDAYTVVFALNDRASFSRSVQHVRYLREDLGVDRTIILVGNKSDLVRQRRVGIKDACALARRYDAKYIETSAELGHQTDELLVGTLRQIRLKLSTSRRAQDTRDVSATSKKHQKWLKIVHLYHFLHGASRSVDSCQNFFV